MIGIGSVANQRRHRPFFQEAQIAVDVGHVFDEDKTVMNFETWALAACSYQLPTTLCGVFLSGCSKKVPSIRWMSTLFSIQVLYKETSLNVSRAYPQAVSCTATLWSTGWRRSKAHWAGPAGV